MRAPRLPRSESCSPRKPPLLTRETAVAPVSSRVKREKAERFWVAPRSSTGGSGVTEQVATTGHRFETDRGLNARMLTVMFLLFVLYAGFVTILLALRVKIALVGVIMAAILLVQFFLS